MLDGYSDREHDEAMDKILADLSMHSIDTWHPSRYRGHMIGCRLDHGYFDPLTWDAWAGPKVYLGNFYFTSGPAMQMARRMVDNKIEAELTELEREL